MLRRRTSWRRPRSTGSSTRLFALLIGLGLGLPHNYLLGVRGRRSGRWYSTPVDVLVHGESRFLVAPRGETQWVRNARASGQATLRKGARREEFRLRPVPDAEKPAYLDRFQRTVRRFFPLPAGSPAAALAPLAGRRRDHDRDCGKCRRASRAS